MQLEVGVHGQAVGDGMGWDEGNCLEMLDEAPFGAIPAASWVMGCRLSTRPSCVFPSWGNELTL